MHAATGLDDTSNRAKTASLRLLEIADLDLRRDGMLILGDQSEPGEAGCYIGDRSRDTSVHQADLLLMFDAEFDHCLHIPWLDHRQVAVDVFHEFLTVQMIPDDLTESRGLWRVLHATKILPQKSCHPGIFVPKFTLRIQGGRDDRWRMERVTIAA